MKKMTWRKEESIKVELSKLRTVKLRPVKLRIAIRKNLLKLKNERLLKVDREYHRRIKEGCACRWTWKEYKTHKRRSTKPSPTWIWCCNKARSFMLYSITTTDITSNGLDYKAVLWSWPLNQIRRPWSVTASCCNNRKSKSDPHHSNYYQLITSINYF